MWRVRRPLPLGAPEQSLHPQLCPTLSPHICTHLQYLHPHWHNSRPSTHSCIEINDAPKPSGCRYSGPGCSICVPVEAEVEPSSALQTADEAGGL